MEIPRFTEKKVLGNLVKMVYTKYQALSTDWTMYATVDRVARDSRTDLS